MEEICPRTEKNFDLTRFPTWNHFGYPSNTGTRSLHLPRTNRGGSKGEMVTVTRQVSRYDHIAALENHARVNEPNITEPIAAFRNSSGSFLGLTLRRLLRRISPILKQNNLPRITGHCFRIGDTTNLLLQGIPPDVVKLLGRWTSDSFLRYWRSLELIAPMWLSCRDRSCHIWIDNSLRCGGTSSLSSFRLGYFDSGFREHSARMIPGRPYLY